MRGSTESTPAARPEIVYNFGTALSLPTMAHLPADTRFRIDYDPRTRVVFGDGALAALGEITQSIGSRVLVVTDAGLAAAGHLTRAREALGELDVVIFEDVHPNPTTEDVERCAEFARSTFGGSGPDVVIGLGGGSSMDCAKGTLFLLSGGGTMHDYRGVGRGRGEFLPLIAIPTTSGTGSEAQSFAVISDAKTHLKMACGDKRAAAKVAILDPELTVTMPAAVTAVTGIDAISHAVETFVTKARTPFSQMYSRQAWRLLSTAFPQVLSNPDDRQARGEMLLGANLAGSAIESSMLGATHAMANPLTAHFDVTHGVAIGVLLPTVIRFNAHDPEIAELYCQLASAVGLQPSAGELADWLEELVRSAGLPTSLGELDVDPQQVGRMADEATEQMTGRFNPRPVHQEEFSALYREAL